jgi:hypothetical protein
MSKRLSNKLDMDQVAGLLDVDTLSTYDDWFIENAYCECSEDDQSNGVCVCGFEDERVRRSNQYLNALESIANKLLGEHGLMLQNTKHSWEKRIIPCESWKDAANKIRLTINGYGGFYFETLKDFLNSGPYTPRGAVLNHLHWLKTWYKVYGYPNAKAQLERAMR